MSVRRQNQHEMIGDSDRAGHVQRRSGSRHIADGAIDSAAAELNRSSLQNTVPRCDLLFSHPVIIGQIAELGSGCQLI